jgi:S1-C subfamily serine protease
LTLLPEPTATLAIPVSVVRVVLPLLMRYRKVPRARLGIGTLPASPSLRAQFLDGAGGHAVHELEAGGPAERHGLKLYDVIYAIEGLPLRSSSPIRDALLPFRPGRTVKLSVLRLGKRIEVEVSLGAEGLR